MAKVRIQDIANEVGVSVVTVHNALSGRKGVSDTVRDKIMEKAREMGYYQEQRRTETVRHIGVIVSEKYLADYMTFYWKMYQEMVLIAPEENCMIIAEILKCDMENERRLPHFIEENAVDGVIVMGETSKQYIDYLKSSVRIPVIIMDFYYKEVAADAVITDGFYGMYLMTEYLYERGFRNIAYVGSIHATSSIMDRYCGFCRCLLEHDLPLRREWRLEDRDCRTGQLALEFPQNMPEAFVCNCDLVASVMIDELEKRGYRVPEDISIVGFDNFLYPGLTHRDITTYAVDMKAMAARAVKKALARIENPCSMQHIDEVPGYLVERGSVKSRII